MRKAKVKVQQRATTHKSNLEAKKKLATERQKAWADFKSGSRKGPPRGLYSPAQFKKAERHHMGPAK